MVSTRDYVFMARALELAEKGRFTSDPNPNVGCVLVKKDRIVGEGWHARTGQDHAEVEALRNAGEVIDATAYVTLEPCSHYGKTPPCSDALIQAGIKRVVTAMQDPNPLVAGNGIRRLQAAGVEVECGIMEQEAETLNRGFSKRMRSGFPYVISKLAMSLDGRTAMASGASKWITSAAARADVHRLRAASSAVLTGINTVLMDDPAMNVRLEELLDLEQPVRVVLDSTLKMPLTAKMVRLPGRTLILTGSEDEKKHQLLSQAGFEVFHIAENKRQRVDLNAALRFLGEQQFNQVLVEAGRMLNGALLTTKLVDEWVVYLAPTVMGDAAQGLFHIPGIRDMADKIDLRINDVRQVGADLRICFTNSR